MPGPSLVDTIGRWFDDGTTNFKSNLQGAQQSFDQFADQTRDAAKDATDAVIGLPNTRIVPVRERCAVAGSGPDCNAAAIVACRSKGFTTGKSLDTQSEQKCPAQVLLRGRAQRWRMSDRDIRDACALPIAGQGIDRGKAALLSKGNVARMSEAICANPGFRCRSSGLRSVLDSTSFLCSNDSI